MGTRRGRGSFAALMPESQPAAEGAAARSAEKPTDVAVSDAAAAPRAAQPPEISRQKQDGHIAGTSQNLNRLKQGKPTSTFDGSQAEADALTQEAWQKGTAVPKRPGVRDYDFGRRIGRGAFGGGQSRVRVYQDSTGKIHGHPEGPKVP